MSSIASFSISPSFSLSLCHSLSCLLRSNLQWKGHFQYNKPKQNRRIYHTHSTKIKIRAINTNRPIEQCDWLCSSSIMIKIKGPANYRICRVDNSSSLHCGLWMFLFRFLADSLSPSLSHPLIRVFLSHVIVLSIVHNGFIHCAIYTLVHWTGRRRFLSLFSFRLLSSFFPLGLPISFHRNQQRKSIQINSTHVQKYSSIVIFNDNSMKYN